jgi:flagellin-like protein
MKKSKRGLSEVVSTVLLILLTVAAAVIVSSFSIKFVMDYISKGDCIKYAQMVEIINNPEYTCYNSTSGNENMRIQIGIKDLESKYYDKLIGFKVILYNNGVSNSYDITNGTGGSGNVRMIRDNASEIITIPGIASEKTYIITGITSKPNSTIVYPVLKDKSCAEAKSELNIIDNCQ